MNKREKKTKELRKNMIKLSRIEYNKLLKDIESEIE